jgi:hypothetical protein
MMLISFVNTQTRLVCSQRRSNPMSEEVTIDAEYMNRWLGESSQVESLSAKTLYDIQTLIEYYRDIIVPESQVKISFPVEGRNSGPRASVESGEVYVPYYMLKDGLVDQTIGAMIHELHHIKLSPSERYIKIVAFKFLKGLMDSIDCVGMTLSERVFSDGDITAGRIFAADDNAGADIHFLRQVLGDLLFFMNAVEDVRIDANTPPNLRKYIDKIDEGAREKLVELFENGDLKTDDITSIGYLILGHHKGMFKSEVVEERFGDTKAIVEGEALKIPLQLFEEFAPEIGKHVLETYYKYCGKPKDPKDTNGSDGSPDLDSYFGGKVQGAVGDKLEKEFSNLPQKQVDDAAEAEESSLDDDLEDAVSKAVAKALEKLAQDEEEGESPNSKASDITLSGDINRSPAEALRADVEDKEKETLMSPHLAQQVKSFKDVQVFTTTEHFNETPVVYDAVIFDTVN